MFGTITIYFRAENKESVTGYKLVKLNCDSVQLFIEDVEEPVSIDTHAIRAISLGLYGPYLTVL